MCCRLQVAPSGESYEGKRRPGRKQRQTNAGIWRDSLHVTCGLTACTAGSAPAQRSVTSMGKLYLVYVGICVQAVPPGPSCSCRLRRLKPPATTPPVTVCRPTTTTMSWSTISPDLFTTFLVTSSPSTARSATDCSRSTPGTATRNSGGIQPPSRSPINMPSVLMPSVL